jgi:ZIP family zinc transporter
MIIEKEAQKLAEFTIVKTSLCSERRTAGRRSLSSLAVGVSFGSGDVAAGLVVAIAIGLQNMPEGLAVALPLLREGYSGRKSLGYGTLTGLVEPVGGLLGVALVSIFHPILPWVLAFASGAMLFVVSDEIVPESHRKGFERQATFGLVAGFIVMMLLDSIFA